MSKSTATTSRLVNWWLAPFPWTAAFFFLVAIGCGRLRGDEPEADFESARNQLVVLQPLVGTWKGVGLQKLGGRDRWAATTEWAWAFDDGRPAIDFTLTPGRYFTTGRIVPGDSPESFRLTLRSTESDQESSATFTGRRDETGQLELTNRDAAAGQPGRLLIKNVADNKRLVIVVQQQSRGDRFLQAAVLGYTREGTVFATRQRPLHECVVTGGEGTQSVRYGGEEYWVCCKGCLSMFQQNPEKVIAAHKARLEKRRRQEAGDANSE